MILLTFEQKEILLRRILTITQTYNHAVNQVKPSYQKRKKLSALANIDIGGYIIAIQNILDDLTCFDNENRNYFEKTANKFLQLDELIQDKRILEIQTKLEKLITTLNGKMPTIGILANSYENTQEILEKIHNLIYYAFTLNNSWDKNNSSTEDFTNGDNNYYSPIVYSTKQLAHSIEQPTEEKNSIQNGKQELNKSENDQPNAYRKILSELNGGIETWISKNSQNLSGISELIELKESLSTLLSLENIPIFDVQIFASHLERVAQNISDGLLKKSLQDARGEILDLIAPAPQQTIESYITKLSFQ